MEKVSRYREVIKRLMQEKARFYTGGPDDGVESVMLMDEERGHYGLMQFGWENGKRVKFITLYVRLKDGKFWIEQDLTEEGIATELLREGVPKEDIVLAFHAPEMRPYTEFAAA
ncbi:MAG: XisI protein [Blastocatellales bacterium]